MQRQSRQGFDEAIGYLEYAIKLEPAWAEPRGELAYAYASASNSRFLDDQVAIGRARKLATEALRLDSRLARAHGALGWTQSLDFFEWPKAESSFRRAVSLDPDDGLVRFWFAVHLRKKGRFREAERQSLIALDSTHRQDARVWSELAFLYWTAGWIDKFGSLMAQQIQLHSNDALTRFLNARLLKLKGRYDEADSELTFAGRLGFNPATVLAERASLCAWRGNAQLAQQFAAELEKLAQTRPIDGLLLAGVYATLGDKDKAFDILEDAYQRHDNTLLSMPSSPLMKPLRSEQRFRNLLKRMNFTDQIMQQMELSSSSLSG